MSKKNQMKFLEFPIFAVCNIGDYVLIGGGGGGSKYGLTCMLMVYKLESPSSETLENVVYKEDTEKDLVSSIVPNFSENKIAISLGSYCVIYDFQPNGQLKRSMKFQSDFAISEPNQNYACFSPNEKYIATGGNDCTLRIWEKKNQILKSPTEEVTMSLFKEYQGHIEPINSIDFNPSNSLVCTTSSDKTCRIFDVAKGMQLKKLTFGTQFINQNLLFRGCRSEKTIYSYRFSRQGDYLFTLETTIKESSYLTKWKTNKEYDPCDTIRVHDRPSSCLFLSKSGKYLGVGTSDGLVKSYFSKNLGKIREGKLHCMPVTNLYYVNEEQKLMSVSIDYAYSFLSNTAPANILYSNEVSTYSKK